MRSGSRLRHTAATARLVGDRLATLGWGLGSTLRLPPRSIATTLRVAVLMGVAEVMVRRRPLPKVTASLGVRLDLRPSGRPDDPFDIATLPGAAQRQIECTNRVADAWPFSDGPCLRRTLVAGRLLRRHDPSIRVGLRGGTSGMVAHAWLEIDGRPLEDVSDVGAFELGNAGVA